MFCAVAFAVARALTRLCTCCPQEDNSLRIAVSNYPYRKGSFAIDWKAVSKQCARTTKQCRERWINVLDPAIRRDAWTFDEIRTLFNAQEELGNKWAAIASRLPGRQVDIAVFEGILGALASLGSLKLHGFAVLHDALAG